MRLCLLRLALLLAQSPLAFSLAPPCSPGSVDASCRLSSGFLHRSVLNAGHLRLPQLWTGERCLKLAVLGGSVSCGMAVGGREKAWPALLVALLNESFPCPAPGHHVANLCVKAVATDYWVDALAGWRANTSHPSAQALRESVRLCATSAAVQRGGVKRRR